MRTPVRHFSYGIRHMLLSRTYAIVAYCTVTTLVPLQLVIQQFPNGRKFLGSRWSSSTHGTSVHYHFFESDFPSLTYHAAERKCRVWHARPRTTAEGIGDTVPTICVWPYKAVRAILTITCIEDKCDPSQQNRAVVCCQEKCDIPFIWKSILLTQRWYHSHVNWMQHCNFMVKNKSKFLFIFFVFSHTNGVISWNAFYRQLPWFDVMGHKW